VFCGRSLGDVLTSGPQTAASPPEGDVVAGLGRVRQCRACTVHIDVFGEFGGLGEDGNSTLTRNRDEPAVRGGPDLAGFPRTQYANHGVVGKEREHRDVPGLEIGRASWRERVEGEEIAKDDKS